MIIKREYMSEYKLKRFTDKNRIPELQELFRKGLGETTREFWEWKYWEENGLPESFILVAEDVNNKIVGMFGFQLLKYLCGDDSIILVQTQDLVIDPVCRGKGLMKTLYTEAMRICKEKGAIAFLAYPNKNSYPIFLKYGASDMPKISSINTRRNYFSCLKKEISELCIGEWSIKITDKIPDNIYNSKPQTSYKLDKNQEYLQWKFDSNPDEEFKWLIIYDKESIKGYFVFSPNRGRISTAVNVYDFDLSEEVPENIIKKAISILKTYGNWVSIWGSFSERESAMLKNAGLRKESKGKTNFTIHSFENKEVNIDLLLTRADLDY